MQAIALIVVGCVVVGIGAFVIRHLGWPKDVEGLVKWGLVLVATAVLVVGVPEFLHNMPSGPLPVVQAGAVLFVLAFIAIGGLGYWGWAHEAAKREKRSAYDERARMLPRRRVPPPAPQHGLPAQDDGFRPVDPDAPAFRGPEED